MTRKIGIQLLRFTLLVLFQVLILNHLNLGGYLNPYFYIYFILLLPFSIPRWLLLVLAFFTGLTIDLFTYTPGLNASATLIMAFFRPSIIRLLSDVPEEELGCEPSLRDNGFTWFFPYAVTLVLIHHVALFYLELFCFAEFFQTLWRVVLSSLFTLLLIFLSELIFYNRGKNNE